MSRTAQSLGAFLRARRDRLQPEDVGLRRGPRRRVPGLRREEVAQLAGISPEYYLRIEQGKDHHPSAEVLAAIGRGLLLDEDALRYLHRLAYPPLRAVRPKTPRSPVPPGLLEMVSQWVANPAYLSDRNLDVLAANGLARALAPGYLEPGTNLVESVFTSGPWEPNPQAWRAVALSLVASLRFHGDPRDPRLNEVVDRLSSQSATFRSLWSGHEARPLVGGRIAVQVEPLGWLHFERQTFLVPGDGGLSLTLLVARDASPEASAIAYLAARERESAVARGRTPGGSPDARTHGDDL